ncbi:hypothetical protein ACFL47_06140 [Candidatus Latescibacterota bacterium]
MKLYQYINTWIVNMLLLFAGVGIIVFYVGGIVLAFIAVAK